MSVGIISQANALTCERYSIDTKGFKDRGSAESWYPKELYLEDENFKPKPNSKQMIYRRETVMEGSGASVVQMYYLLTNAKLISAVQARAGYRNPGEARYKCNIDSVELKSKLASRNQNESTNSKTDTSTQKENAGDKKSVRGIQAAEKKCAEIGYTSGTEKYADCVMKLMN